MYRRSKEVESNDAADENGDPLSGSSDPFDALVSGKTDDTSSRSNGKRQPSPVQGMIVVYVHFHSWFSCGVHKHVPWHVPFSKQIEFIQDRMANKSHKNYAFIRTNIDDSDGENDTETKNDDDKSETNGDSAVESAGNGDADASAGGEDEAYEVEDIVDHKFKGKKKFFKIRWKNCECTVVIYILFVGPNLRNGHH